ncbi:MAG: lipoyl synthase [Armatimonadetes bacterium]|nr:lipoyl synthase [Armatimonadota bacterium]
MNRRLPPWLTKRIPSPATVAEVDRMVRAASLHTVCESARCPNIGECWSRRTATFMILGDTCTRNCGFCAIKVGRPDAPDADEPRRVAETAAAMSLKHVVVTSVTRDDLPDRGAGQFRDTIRAIREALPEATVEALTPDFLADPGLIETVVQESPDIFNHNIETVERLSPTVRPQARYERSLTVLRLAKAADRDLMTKSGLMLGLGETRTEVVSAMSDLRAADVDVLTIGQYLRPTLHHLPVVEYIEPSVFEQLEAEGYRLGFRFVASSPFTRSSYNADRVLAGRDRRAPAAP